MGWLARPAHVIDVLTQPDLADEERILATPTLVKEDPAPVRRIVGDLSDTEQVLLGLALWPCEKTALHLWMENRTTPQSAHRVG